MICLFVCCFKHWAKANALAKQKASLGSDSTRGTSVQAAIQKYLWQGWLKCSDLQENTVHGSHCPETLSSLSVVAAWNQAKGQDSMHDPFLGSHFAKCFLPTYSCRVPHPVPGMAWSFLGIGNCTLTSLKANCFNASWMYLGYRPLTTGSSFIHRPEVP